VFAVVICIIVCPVVIGGLLPGIPIVGVLGTVCESFFTIHIVLLACAGLASGLWAWRSGRKRLPAVVAVINGLAVLGALVPFGALMNAAHDYGAPISWFAHWHVTAEGSRSLPDSTVPFATLGGRTLSLDVYAPNRTLHPPPWPQIFMVHGGGFTQGSRSQGRNWDRWLAERGYAVFDVDYRLAPPVTWNLAAQDVACAMAWVQARAPSFDIDVTRSAVAGQSAGGTVALQVAYELGDGTVSSSCGGTATQPQAVIAFYPAEDLALVWSINLSVGPLSGQGVGMSYIGGSPRQTPDRYRATNTLAHVRMGLPPTLVAYGEHDHVIPTLGHAQLAARLKDAGVESSVVAIPYGDHGYDLMWGSIGAQITRHVIDQFLAREYPVVSPGK
jgi:acetyl esterase/lipase